MKKSSRSEVGGHAVPKQPVVGEMSEVQILVMAALAWASARGGIDVSLIPAALGVGLAVWMRRPWLVLAAIVLVVGGRSSQVTESLIELPAGPYSASVRLRTDPKPTGYGWSARAQVLDGNFVGSRIRLNVPFGATGRADSLFGGANAGDVFAVAGTAKPILPSSWSLSQHLVGQIGVNDFEQTAGPPWWTRPSDGLRDLVGRGAMGIPEKARPLYLGLVIGDDRDQSLGQRSQFRATGMAHLLAVSGQNVAFALAVIAPLTSRLGGRRRLLVIMTALAIFALATRLEPSVIRATASAAVAAGAVASSRRSAGTRTLGLALVGILLWDPLLAFSVGFNLSVLASGGILLFGGIIAARLPKLPKSMAEAVGITVGAQVGVAPLLLALFGPISLATLPANLLAGWAAGAVMTWGLSFGIVVGLLPAWSRSVLSLPVRLLVWWIDLVARWGGGLPLPLLTGNGLLALVGLAIGIWLLRDQRKLRTGVIAAAVVLSLAAIPSPPSTPGSVLGGDRPWHASGQWWPRSDRVPSVLVLSNGAGDSLIADLVTNRVTAIDIVIVTQGATRSGRLMASIKSVSDVGLVLAPPQHRVPGGRRVVADRAIPVLGGVLVLEPKERTLEVQFMGLSARP